MCEDMRNTGVLGMPEEYFIPLNPATGDISWEMAWESIQIHGSTSNNVFAVKVMADQLACVDECFRSFSSVGHRSTASLFDYFYEHFQDAKWIYLVREDIAAQAISQSIAHQSGVNHAVAHPDEEHFAGRLMRGYRDDYSSQVRFELSTLRQRFSRIAEQHIVWRAFFRSHGINPLVLRYEDTMANFPGYLYRLASYVGVSLEGAPGLRKLIRLSNKKNDEWYFALAEALGTSSRD